jgi:hypothetical protein
MHSRCKSTYVSDLTLDSHLHVSKAQALLVSTVSCTMYFNLIKSNKFILQIFMHHPIVHFKNELTVGPHVSVLALFNENVPGGKIPLLHHIES